MTSYQWIINKITPTFYGIFLDSTFKNNNRSKKDVCLLLLGFIIMSFSLLGFKTTADQRLKTPAHKEVHQRKNMESLVNAQPQRINKTKYKIVAEKDKDTLPTLVIKTSDSIELKEIMNIDISSGGSDFRYKQHTIIKNGQTYRVVMNQEEVCAISVDGKDVTKDHFRDYSWLKTYIQQRNSKAKLPKMLGEARNDGSTHQNEKAELEIASCQCLFN